MLKNRKSLSSKHHIARVITSLAGCDDEYYELNTLDWFRTNVLEKNPKYAELLLKYDSVDSILADKLEKSAKNNQEIILVLLNKYVRTTCNYINKGKNFLSLNDPEMADVIFKKATLVYSSMVNNLYNEFYPTYTTEEHKTKAQKLI